MRAYSYISLKQVPAVRLLVTFITGILLQWYAQLSLITIAVSAIMVTALITGFSFLPQYKKFTIQWLQGVLLLLLFTASGALLTYTNNIQHQPHWFQNIAGNNNNIIIATIDEPLVTKPNSFKANARVTTVQSNHTAHQVTGSILIYFSKDNSITSRIHYGSQIAFSKALQPVQNSGNPGSFNYQRYLLFQGITSQVYLQQKDFIILPQQGTSAFQTYLQKTRSFVITALQQFIPGKKEQGIAEALLIGYRNDLDKQLVQSYSRTGVVHIIAISGLHLGMIYGVLLYLFSPFKSRKWYRFVMPVIVLTVLWLFTFIAGGVPSIVRSAVMFSFIVLGECLQRKGNIYNTLAVSALCLLIYNPFFLWDVGFQLSYTAVTSIVIFLKPIYNSLYFENKFINRIWLLVATTIAAQILTLPIVLYCFHQFPLLFLVTNLFVVPLSTAILFLEILLVLTTSVTCLATLLGKLASGLLWLMNTFIEHIEKFPFASWQGIQIDGFQAISLYIILLLLLAWLFTKNSKGLLSALSVMLIYVVYTSADVYSAAKQHKLIVYNIPKAAAIDIIQGNKSKTLMSAALASNVSLQSFYLQPTRLLFRTMPAQSSILTANSYTLHIANKSVLVIGKPLPPSLPPHKLSVDAVIITGNPSLYIDELYALVSSPLIIFDSSNPAWKIEKWKKDCNSLHLRFHSVAQQGAFIMDW